MIRPDPTIRLPLFTAIGLVALFVVFHAWNIREQAPREYSNECSICHHGGHGQVHEFAPIFGRVGRIAQTPAGRRYIIDVLLNGLDGPITAGGAPYDGAMPSFQRLSDEELARILTFVAAQEMPSGPPGFTAGEIAQARLRKLSPHEVLLERQALDREEPLP